MLLSEKFYRDNLKIAADKISYKEIFAEKIIFCEGAKGTENSFFESVPFKPVKGEVLTVKIPGMPADRIWNKGIFINPAGNDIFDIGATYQWNFTDSKPSPEGKKMLEKKLAKAINLHFEILDHRAAIRPAVVDRRPVLGWNSKFKNVGIFNGMGTKGASLAPFFAKHFCDHLLHDQPIMKEVNIERFPGNLAF